MYMIIIQKPNPILTEVDFQLRGGSVNESKHYGFGFVENISLILHVWCNTVSSCLIKWQTLLSAVLISSWSPCCQVMNYMVDGFVIANQLKILGHWRFMAVELVDMQLVATTTEWIL